MCHVSTGGKQLFLHGGQSRSHESTSSETLILNMDTMHWEKPELAQGMQGVYGHSATVVSRAKLLVSHGFQTSLQCYGASMLLLIATLLLLLLIHKLLTFIACMRPCHA